MDSKPAPGVSPSRYLPLLLLLFAGSGCSALIYEIVWYQILQLAIGSTAVSMGFLLATYMGGLCIGSIGLPKLKMLRQNPLRLYALLELGIALLGVLVLVGLPLIDRIYIAAAGIGMPGMLMRGWISAVILLPPTILMGASLPAIARWVELDAARGFLVGACCMAATPWARCWDACWRASICCAFMTSRWPRWRLWASIW